MIICVCTQNIHELIHCDINYKWDGEFHINVNNCMCSISAKCFVINYMCGCASEYFVSLKLAFLNATFFFFLEEDHINRNILYDLFIMFFVFARI